MNIYLVVLNIDLGSHVQGAYLNREDTIKARNFMSMLNPKDRDKYEIYVVPVQNSFNLSRTGYNDGTITLEEEEAD